MRLKPVLLSVVVAVAVLGGLYAWTWTDPVRGLERSFGKFLSAIEDRDWARAEGLVAEDYRDGFGLDRKAMLSLGGRVFERFETLSLSGSPARVEVDGNRGTLWARVVVTGRGDGVAMAIMQGSRFMETQTEFVWRRTGRPWEWQLVGMRNPDVAPFVKQVEGMLDSPPVPGL